MIKKTKNFSKQFYIFTDKIQNKSNINVFFVPCHKNNKILLLFF